MSSVQCSSGIFERRVASKSSFQGCCTADKALHCLNPRASKNQLRSRMVSIRFIVVLIVVLMTLSSNALSMKSNAFKKFLIKSTAAISSFGLIVNTASADMTAAPFDDKIKYEVVTVGSGDQPKVGDLVSIRFKASYKGKDFDNTFETPQPYMYRAGVGLVVKGLDTAVVNMHVGDRYKLTFGGDYAFPGGRGSSAGKPRIPPGADIDYEVQLVELPGKGEDYIADVDEDVSE